ncbi:Mth938-like domain-containing protein [Sneathiella sp.]|uniref:Mth938-like domain-containing protein n=1 Tax=Sneathiella sp. TaxID=1964365 RepID=UPI003569D789
MQDISGLPKAGQQLINSYGDGGFRVSGVWYDSSSLVLPEMTLPWPVTHMDELSVDSLTDVIAKSSEVEILLIGCGTNMAFIEEDLRQSLRQHGIVIDAMDTGAAVRTYNVLLLEGRQVAAALIAV